MVGGPKRQTIYSCKIPTPSVQFTQTEMFGSEESDNEGMHNVGVLDKATLDKIKNNVQFSEFHARPTDVHARVAPPKPAPVPESDQKQSAKKKSTIRRVRKTKPVPAVSPPKAAKAASPVEPQPVQLVVMPEYRGKNKYAKVLHKMQQRQNALLEKFGIQAPCIDLSVLDDDDDDARSRRRHRAREHNAARDT